ncbi:hypothetical protein MMC14_000525 [Varicellaria rhodocarpa]|nr:hypothetical protein [Varicellaria rhodocarpa]
MLPSNHKIRHSLIRLNPLFGELCKISGAPGLAIGIIYNGKIVHEDYLGYRDVEKKLRVDKNTIFAVAAHTNAMTAAAVGILVEEDALEWFISVYDIILEMSKSLIHRDIKFNMVDLLSHRSGVTWADAYYLQSKNNILLSKKEIIRTFESLRLVS